MNEFDLIIKYLEKTGIHKVTDVCYFNEGATSSIANIWHIGVFSGVPMDHCWFFGNLHLRCRLSGVIVLGNSNIIEGIFSTENLGVAEPGVIWNYFTVGQSLTLLGDGTYYGEKRFYGLGFNRVDLTFLNIGAAVVSWTFNANGYLFKFK